MSRGSHTNPEPNDSERTRVTRLGIKLAVTCGGVAALSWEVLWQLQAALALGISALGTAVTLSTTMFGMAVGSLLAGRALRRRSPARPLRVYGSLELVIGVAGLAMLPGFAVLEQVDVWLYSLAPAAATAGHALGIAMILGPATLAMGATIPVFQTISRMTGVRISVLYGLNTAGACAGVIAISFGLLPTLGVTLTVLTIAAINLCVAATMWFMPAHGEPVSNLEEQIEIAPERGTQLSFGLAQIVVCVTGLATFGLEVAWFRALRSAFWSTTDSFAIILASVLGPLALSAQLVPWIRSRGIALGWPVSAAGVAILLATPLVERMDLLYTGLNSHFETLAQWLALSLGILGPPMFLLGVALPWFLESYPNPRDSARLYALNAMSSVVGSLLAAWWWLPAVGFARTSWVLGICVVCVGAAISSPPMRLRVAGVGAVAVFIAASLTSSAGRDRAYQRPDFASQKLVAIHEGPDSTVTVTESNGVRTLLIDGFAATTESLGADYMQWMGRLPMLLHPDPHNALVICFGTGQTAWAVLDEGPSHLDVVDVNEAVLRMGPLFPANHGVLDDPRVVPTVMDGRAWLRRTRTRYDVVTLEPMPPNFAGVNALYSREFYQLVAGRLEPDGVVAQWLPHHLVSPDHAAAIAATFIESFPNSMLWIDPLNLSGILVGRISPGDVSRVAEWPGFVRPATGRALGQSEVGDRVVLGPGALTRYAAEGVVISDDNQLLAFGQMHAGSRGNRARRLLKQNFKILKQFREKKHR